MNAALKIIKFIHIPLVFKSMYIAIRKKKVKRNHLQEHIKKESNPIPALARNI